MSELPPHSLWVPLHLRATWVSNTFEYARAFLAHFPQLLLLRIHLRRISTMDIHRRTLVDVHVRASTSQCQIAKILSLSIRPSVEKSPASFGSELLGETLFSSLMRVYLNMGVRRSTRPTSILKGHSPCRLLHHQRCTIHLSKSLATHFWCRAILTTVSSETRI
jgi:hypothetical protein